MATYAYDEFIWGCLHANKFWMWWKVRRQGFYLWKINLFFRDTFIIPVCLVKSMFCVFVYQTYVITAEICSMVLLFLGKLRIRNRNCNNKSSWIFFILKNHHFYLIAAQFCCYAYIIFINESDSKRF